MVPHRVRLDGPVDRQQGRVSHPLDHPVWHALTTRQAAVAQRRGTAVRLRPDHGVFAATEDASPDSCAALLALECDEQGLWFLQRDAVEPPPGFVRHRQAECVQMVADRMEAAEPDFAVQPLGDEDAGQMLALARMTEPGPFFEKTHRLGRFIGVKRDKRLIAMAGERLQPPGFTEVSGVCTHPDHRGQGYAGALMRIVAARILDRGETPFLHAYASNAGAVALYERLGFRVRSSAIMTVLRRI